MKLFS